MIIIDKADTAIIRLEIDHTALEALYQLRVVNKDVRTFGAANHLGFFTKRRIDMINPRTSRIDNDLRLNRESRAIRPFKAYCAVVGCNNCREIGCCAFGLAFKPSLTSS